MLNLPKKAVEMAAFFRGLKYVQNVKNSLIFLYKCTNIILEVVECG